jgi:hypothetical protein
MSASTKIGMAVLEPEFIESPKARWLGAVEVLAGNNRWAMRVHYIIFESEIDSETGNRYTPLELG